MKGFVCQAFSYMISRGEIRIKLKDELISAILGLIFGIIRYMYYPARQEQALSRRVYMHASSHEIVSCMCKVEVSSISLIAVSKQVRISSCHMLFEEIRMI